MSALDEDPVYQQLPFVMVRRKPFASAAGQGLSVHEVRPKNQKACRELDNLMQVLDERPVYGGRQPRSARGRRRRRTNTLNRYFINPYSVFKTYYLTTGSLAYVHYF